MAVDGIERIMDDDAAAGDAPGPSPQRQARFFTLLYSPDEVAARSRRIYDEMLALSKQVREPNFTVIGTDDLERLFAGYDREFFRGRLAEMLLEDGAHPMGFRLSRRLTSAAGQTMRWTRKIQRDGKPALKYDYEITVSTTLLFNTFQHLERRVTVGGLVCQDRLEALQRIFEHELLHLAEFLGWGKSNCRANNFHALSRRIFAHEGAYHDLVTPRAGGGRVRHRRRRPGPLRARGPASRRPRQPDHPPGHRPGRGPRRPTVFRRQALSPLLRAAGDAEQGQVSRAR